MIMIKNMKIRFHLDDESRLEKNIKNVWFVILIRSAFNDLTIMINNTIFEYFLEE